jgi:translation elongation factor EF-1alpha
MAEEKRIGVVTHYFGKITVAIIKVEEESLKIGDTIHFKGHTSDFTQKVESMELEHKAVPEAKVGDSIGIKVSEHAREGDVVYKVVE